MEWRALGRTGIKVSQFCLGTMMFGGRSDKADPIEMIDYALSAGVNFIDTADAYAGNESERIIGEALARDGARENPILATRGFVPQSKDIKAGGASRRHTSLSRASKCDLVFRFPPSGARDSSRIEVIPERE